HGHRRRGGRRPAAVRALLPGGERDRERRARNGPRPQHRRHDRAGARRHDRAGRRAEQGHGLHDHAPGSTPAVAGGRLSTVAGAGARQTILVVDDDDDIRDLLANLLRRAGYRTIEASTGQEGLRRLFEDRPALVILDVMLPYLDGWRTLERIRDISDVAVLMLTARGAELER